MMFADDGEMLVECVFFFSLPSFLSLFLGFISNLFFFVLAILAVTLRMSSGKISSVYENSV